MTTPLSAAALLISETADTVFAAALELASSIGLPVTSWRTGDPTRTQLRAQAKKLEALDAVRVEYAKSAFLETAEGDMCTLRAKDVYNVERDEATYATPTLTLDNGGGGYYEIDARGLTVMNSVTGATYTNQLPVTIAALATGVEVVLEAEEAGSAGTVGVDDIDTIVAPPLLGVTIAGNTAGVGVDEQSDAGVKDECSASLGALSPDGPIDGYEYVARNAELTGIVGVTRAFADGDNATGTVAVYVGTATASLGAPEIAAIQAAVDVWSQPLCTDATVASMSPVTQDTTFTITPASPAAQAAVEVALDAYFASWDYDRQGGLVARDALASVVRGAVASSTGATPYTVVVTAPASDQVLTSAQFPVRGTVTLL